jgi:hypothetical protein
MFSSESTEPFPPYTYVPGGPWPHPSRSPQGPSCDRPAQAAEPSTGSSDWFARRFHRGIELFNAGYYWEAHEVWEELWHACGRRGTTADLLRALIKLAAAGVKVRERQEHGVRTHARRAAELLISAQERGDASLLGLDLAYLIERAHDVATDPPRDPGPQGAPVTQVFRFQITRFDPSAGAKQPQGEAT